MNFIRRNRHDWNSFYVLIPDFVYNFADFDYEKSKRGENDSIYVYADIYDMNDNLVCEGSYYVYWVRTPVKKDTTCYHTDCEITENVISRTPLSEDYVLIKYDRIRVCKNCGKKFVEKIWRKLSSAKLRLLANMNMYGNIWNQKQYFLHSKKRLVIMVVGLLCRATISTSANVLSVNWWRIFRIRRILISRQTWKLLPIRSVVQKEGT